MDDAALPGSLRAEVMPAGAGRDLRSPWHQRPGTAPILSPDFAAALRGGPLHTALDLAIKRRGISLEALQRRLAERGVHVGLSTLSYWRRGRRHPEGERSVQALRALEAVLGIPDNSLVAHTAATPGGRRSTGRRPSPVTLDHTIGLTRERIAAMSGIDLDANLRLDLIQTHYVVSIDADRAERHITFSCAVSCRTDGADRYTILYDTRAASTTPVIEKSTSCRIGRIRTEPGHGVLAAEMRFDYPLHTGETYIFGFDISVVGSRPRAPISSTDCESRARSSCWKCTSTARPSRSAPTATCDAARNRPRTPPPN
ncbi:multiprotein-bridging factor 1 family protein [Catenulispora yoronensis]